MMFDQYEKTKFCNTIGKKMSQIFVVPQILQCSSMMTCMLRFPKMAGSSAFRSASMRSPPYSVLAIMKGMSKYLRVIGCMAFFSSKSYF